MQYTMVHDNVMHHEKAAQSTVMGRGSTNASHLLRRLARQDEKKGTDFLDRYEAGEFKSVRAAAKAANIIKDDPPLKQAQKVIKKLSAKE